MFFAVTPPHSSIWAITLTFVVVEIDNLTFVVISKWETIQDELQIEIHRENRANSIDEITHISDTDLSNVDRSVSGFNKPCFVSIVILFQILKHHGKTISHNRAQIVCVALLGLYNVSPLSAALRHATNACKSISGIDPALVHEVIILFNT